MGFRRIGVPFLRNWQGVFFRVSFPYLCFGLELNLLAQLSFVPSNDYASAHADHFRFSFAPEEGRFREGLISLSWATSLPYNAGAWLLVGLPSPFVPLLYHNLGEFVKGFLVHFFSSFSQLLLSTEAVREFFSLPLTPIYYHIQKQITRWKIAQNRDKIFV